MHSEAIALTFSQASMSCQSSHRGGPSLPIGILQKSSVPQRGKVAKSTPQLLGEAAEALEQRSANSAATERSRPHASGTPPDQSGGAPGE